MTDIPIPFPASPLTTFAALRARWPAAVWLDGAAGGRYSIMSAAPRGQLVTRFGRTRWLPGNAERTAADDPATGQDLGDGDPLAILQTCLGDSAPGAMPFRGGAIGYFGYELGRRLEHQETADAGLPDMAVGLYDWALVLDHDRQRAWLAGDPPAGMVDTLDSGADASVGDWWSVGDVRATPDREGYGRAFRRVRDYLQAGDCYQVNLARRLQAPFAGDPLGVYADFRDAAGGPFAAYLDLPGGPILSGSPERFLSLRGNRVETAPIKGTRRRGADPVEDAALRDDLLTHPKDRAENLMIVDLLRNDLGRACEIGSVQVPRLFALESFVTVHHMVSTITGRLRSDRAATDLLRDCLPGGSITGAPKYRAMEIIDELEGEPRGIYCGSIGYIGDDGAMDTSIAIRTMTARDGNLDYRAGGGLVHDSDCGSEYDETESKAAAFRHLVDIGRDRAAARHRRSVSDRVK
ncbi:aminodeoxychorismate synthase component I [Spiribacter vilamensis]|uniref:aminodeoxychorismate synthase n=1 Tax=Spiribacter vilamensis TaxID=531306 RepID=A0A4Q8D112_9GAMM|nr:aminodeoxychorismate synthase component I [Spiribacter vilamensis]RZU99061.1 para-aminobenzoate synthetase component 1 [Spiribacter vilamensis]TVO61940.1 aminodeoxychorismate synthase component I [Spiribacter vilamensis]